MNILFFTFFIVHIHIHVECMFSFLVFRSRVAQGATYIYSSSWLFNPYTMSMRRKENLFHYKKFAFLQARFYYIFVRMLYCCKRVSGECDRMLRKRMYINGAWGSECLYEWIIVIIIKKICFIYFISGAPDHSPDAHTEIIRIHFQVSRMEPCCVEYRVRFYIALVSVAIICCRVYKREKLMS